MSLLAERRTEASRDPMLSAGRSCPALFTVDVRTIPGETVLELYGELDISTQQHFASALAGVDESVARIVLDLSGLTFIDCGNIGLIYQTRVLAGLRGTQLELRDANPQLMRIFDLTGLTASNGNGVRPIQPSPSRACDRPHAGRRAGQLIDSPSPEGDV
jgi:anti-anti-sigma factor